MINESVKKWLIKAEHDLKIVEVEFKQPEDEIVTDMVCFHCQQSAEKCLKAFLVSRNLDFGKTHNLEYLIKLCSKYSAEFAGLDVGDLTFYAVEVRYPDEFYIPSIDEAKECFKIALSVKDFVFKRLNIKEE